MPFPEVKRVIYNKNPLEQVVCQLRFPPILKIDAEIPAEFQESIRQEFPDYSEASEWKVDFSPKFKGQIPPELLAQLLQSSNGKNYEFFSYDGLWKINLTRTFVALTANRYERWEKFKEKLTTPLNALVEIYSPAYFSRIGLRYVDVIRRSVLDLDGVNWTELLQPHILGVLSVPVIGGFVNSFESKYEMSLADKQSAVRMITKFVEAADNGEICYMLDSDFYNAHKTQIDEAITKLDYLNVRASWLIQWSITNRLHQAMEPKTL